MSWKEIKRDPLIGELNVNRFVKDDKNGLYLQRIPKENRRILTSIQHEYGYMGFNDAGGKFRRRKPSEQFQLTRKAAFAGLRVLPPIDEEGDTTIYPFFTDAQTLDQYLPQASPEEAERITYQIFDDLRRAHQLGIIYGDRWSHNMLVIPQYGFINVDFDIEISGPPAKELELAQAAYYTLSGGREKVLSMLSQILVAKNWFNLDMMETFLQRHSVWFNETKFGGIQEETGVLIDLLNRNNRDIT